MARFTVGIVGHGVNPHARCFEDFASAIADALRVLGHDVVPPTDAKPGRLLVFGGNNLLDPNSKLPEDAILYNPEQLASAVGEHLMQNRALWRGHVVWDYSRANIERLKEFGIDRGVHCPVSYVPSMSKIKPAHKEDIDVLFYGSVNPRRKKILRDLEDARLNVVSLWNVYGAERDEVISRSKIVLNLHFYDNPVFEIFRCSHLLANRKCVVSEGGGIDRELEDFAKRATALVPYDKIVETCVGFIKAPAIVRDSIAETGFEEFAKLDLVEAVRKAVAAS